MYKAVLYNVWAAVRIITCSLILSLIAYSMACFLGRAAAATSYVIDCVNTLVRVASWICSWSIVAYLLELGLPLLATFFGPSCALAGPAAVAATAAPIHAIPPLSGHIFAALFAAFASIAACCKPGPGGPV